MTVIWILGSVSDKTFLGKPHSKTVVVLYINLRISYISRCTLQTMLAHHGRPALAGFDVLWEEQNAIVEYVRPDIKHHLVASEFGSVEDHSRAGIGGKCRRGKPPEHLLPKVIPVEFCRPLPELRRGRVGIGPEFLPSIRGLSDQRLCEPNHLVELAMQARG